MELFNGELNPNNWKSSTRPGTTRTERKGTEDYKVNLSKCLTRKKETQNSTPKRRGTPQRVMSQGTKDYSKAKHVKKTIN